MRSESSKDPLHGVTLEMIVNRLVEQYGWEELGKRIPIRCFTNNPSLKSSLTFCVARPGPERRWNICIWNRKRTAIQGVERGMNNWYSLSLGDGITSAIPAADLEEAFAEQFAASDKPVAMAVFTRPESEGRLHCEVIAYFSPAARVVAEAFDAEPCEKPAPQGLGLLAGDASCWSLLFPEGGKS